jgi:tRNA-dihydrouridine synthase B
MKQFASWFTHGVPHGAHLRKAVYESRTSGEILDAVDRFFEKLLAGTIADAAMRSQDRAEPVPA